MPIPTKEIKDGTFSVLLENATNTFSQSADWYDAKFDYPKNSKVVQDQIFQKWEDFNGEYKLDSFKTFDEASSSLGLFSPEQKYSFFASYELAHTTSTISYVYQIYNYTGGAHGGTLVYPITLDEKQQIIPIDRILPDDKLEKVSKLAYNELLKQRHARMKEFGMKDSEISDALKDDDGWMKEGTAPTRENYSAVWLDGDSLVVSFGQYQVAPYAEGIFEVSIPIGEINN
jgi:hypothetical protein